jgi:hypothetical protein
MRWILAISFSVAVLGLGGCSDSNEPSDTGTGMDTGSGDTSTGDTGTTDTGTGDTSVTDTGTGDTGSGGDGGTCTPACDTDRDCCSGECTNLQNDPRNCGGCGTECGDGTYCTGGSCVDIPCESKCAGDETCCGTMCCGAGTICCDPQGPISRGPECVTPDDRGTCPVGCAPLCMEE